MTTLTKRAGRTEPPLPQPTPDDPFPVPPAPMPRHDQSAVEVGLSASADACGEGPSQAPLSPTALAVSAGAAAAPRPCTAVDAAPLVHGRGVTPSVPAPAGPPAVEMDAGAGMPEVIRRAQAGDQQAWTELYERYQDTVYRFLYGKVRNRHLAEDLAHDVWVRALGRLAGGYSWQGKDLGAWLVRIARNLAIDHGKGGPGAREVAVEVVRDDADLRSSPVNVALPAEPERVAVDNLARRGLVAVLVMLRDHNAEQYEVLVLRYLDGLSVAETARVMDRNEGAVKALQYRALSSLRRLLRRHAQLRRALYDEVVPR